MSIHQAQIARDWIGAASLRTRLVAVLASMVMLVTTVSCSPDPPVSFPPTPTGNPIVSVVDLPLGDIHVDGFTRSVAPDDTSGDVFFLGRSKSRRPDMVKWNPDGLYRLDPKTGPIKLAGLEHGPNSYLSGIAATNGWVFWVERDLSLFESDSTVRQDFLAMRADGSGRTLLSRVETRHVDSIFDPRVKDVGFSAGGGTAMWLKEAGRGYTLHLFDTATEKKIEVWEQPEVLAMGQVYGDRVLLPTAAEQGRVMQIYSISSGQVMDLPAVFDRPSPCWGPQMCTAFNAQVIVALDVGQSQLPSCSFASPDSVACTDSVSLLSRWADLRCVAGTYAVGSALHDDKLRLELRNVAEPADPLDLGAIAGSDVACGGRRVVHTWFDTAEDGRSSRDYLRVITLA